MAEEIRRLNIVAIVNITTRSDCDFVRAFVYQTQVPNATGTYDLVPFNLTGAKMRMGIRKQAEDHEEQILLTTENDGIVIFDAGGGKFYVTIRQTELLELPAGTYVHSLIRIMTYRDQDFRYAVWSGTLTHTVGPSREGGNEST